MTSSPAPQDADRAATWLNRLGWSLVVGSTVFLLVFFIANGGGLLRLVAWLGAALASIPQAISNLATHYASLNALQWLLPIGLGAALGASYAAYTWNSTRAIARRPMPALQMPTLLGAALLGALGSQILVLPTRHCTYAADVDGVQVIIGVALTFVGAFACVAPLSSVWQRRYVQTDLASAGYFRARLLPYLLLVPMLLSLLLFLYLPSVQTAVTSLTSRRFPLPNEQFVCLANYAKLAGDVIYQNSFLTTAWMTVIVVVSSMFTALMIATLAAQKIRFASVYRTLLIWPFALSPVVAGAVFLAMFRDGQTGLINAVLNATTGTVLPWLRDASLARVTIVLASVWNILGFNVLFYIAGLQNVPKDLLEAAGIDGANRVQRFWRITFPLLAPYSFFLLVTNVTYSFYGIYGAVDTLTQGGPPLGAAGSLGGATNVLIYKLYTDAFSPGSPLGLAGAQAIILFVIVASLTLLQFQLIERRITYGD